MWTSFSVKSPLRSSSRSRSREGLRATSIALSRSEAQAALTGGIGQRLDAAMKEITSAVEYDLSDACLHRTLGKELADLGSSSLVRARLELALDIILDARGGGERHALCVIDQLGVDVLGGTEYRQARLPVRDLLQGPPYALGAALELFVVGAHRFSRYFFLPSLRRMNSP